MSVAEVRAAGGYSVVYADPAWAYKDKVRKTLDEAHYATLSPEQIRALRVVDLAAKDCALFIWCTWPQTPNLFDVIHAWGFEFKTMAFVWVKRNVKAGSLFWGAGSWTRANTEPCWLAVRGKPRRIDAGVHQLVEDFETVEVLDSTIGEHSAKPPVVRDKIVKLMGDVPRIELFARERVENWDCWGNDARLGGSDVDL